MIAPTATATETTVSVNVQSLRTALLRTAFAADDSASRYALNCVRLEFRGDKLNAIGTDARRLALFETECLCHSVDDFDEMIPRKDARQLISKITKTAADSARISFVGSSFSVTWTGHRRKAFKYEGKLTQGRFPDWPAVFPGSFNGSLTTTVGELAEALRPLSGVLFSLSQERSQIELGKRKQFCGEVTGTPCDVELDPDFVLQWLDTLPDSAPVRMEYTDDVSVVVFSSGSANRYAVMPMSR